MRLICLISLINGLFYDSSAQLLDTSTVFSKWQDIGMPNGAIHYQKQKLIPVSSNTFKLIHSISVGDDMSTIDDTTFSPFPPDVSFYVDTSAVEMFYDSNPNFKFTLFDFSAHEEDTLEIFCFSYDNFQPITGEYIKVKIDSIRTQNFPLFGLRQVYYFHQLLSFGFPFLICDIPRSYWIRGGINGHGGILNQGQNWTSYIAKSECYVENSVQFPLTANGNCSLFTSNKIELNKEMALLFPNPAINSVSLKFNYEASRQITLIDLFGKVVWSSMETQDNIVIDLKDFNRGIYLIKIDNGSSIQSFRLILN